MALPPNSATLIEVNEAVPSAETLLREIATELVRLALDERSRPLHLEVLALNRVVSSWPAAPPRPEAYDAMLDALRVLRAKVDEVRSVSEVRMRSTAPRQSVRAFKIR
jgi:hypothetical protein